MLTATGQTTTPTPTQNDAPAWFQAPIEHDCTPHPPIQIHGDHELLVPSSGVTNPHADGTEQDPYIIEGWCILLPQELELLLGGFPIGAISALTETGISIHDTTAHVTVRDNHIHGYQTGILLGGTHNVHLENNTLTQQPGTGIEIHGSTGTTIQDNRLTEQRYEALTVATSTDTRIHDNTLTASNGHGLGIIHADATHIEHNTIQNNKLSGITVNGDTHHTTIQHNHITQNQGTAISIHEAVNDIPADTSLTHNNLHDNGAHGLFAEAHTGPIQATHNWWGHTTGPSGDETDACTGTTANGHGARIHTDDADVCFEPWLETENPQAGTS